MVFPPFTCTLLPALKLSGRRDIRPLGPTPTQSRIPLRGLIDFWRPREFRFIQELCPVEPVKLRNSHRAAGI